MSSGCQNLQMCAGHLRGFGPRGLAQALEKASQGMPANANSNATAQNSRKVSAHKASSARSRAAGSGPAFGAPHPARSREPESLSSRGDGPDCQARGTGTSVASLGVERRAEPHWTAPGSLLMSCPPRPCFPCPRPSPWPRPGGAWAPFGPACGSSRRGTDRRGKPHRRTRRSST
eukprot:15469116-Alexandrium_andersonii.AAC.1